MAELNTAQKAPLNVTTAAGAAIRAGDLVATVTGSAVRIVGEGGYDGILWVVADEAGTATIGCTYAGQSGSLAVTVTAAPLVMALGTAVTK